VLGQSKESWNLKIEMWQFAAWSGLLHTSGASDDYGAIFE
jgi:hypothetical protein